MHNRTTIGITENFRVASNVSINAIVNVVMINDGAHWRTRSPIQHVYLMGVCGSQLHLTAIKSQLGLIDKIG